MGTDGSLRYGVSFGEVLDWQSYIQHKGSSEINWIKYASNRDLSICCLCRY